MRTHTTVSLIGLVLLAGCSFSGGNTDEGSSSSSVESSVMSTPAAEAVILSPAANAIVTSPLTVKGKAENFWFFEASLPVKITDADGNVLAQAPGQAKTDWMTPGVIEFEATLTFTTTAKTGFLIVANDNPSGDPERDKQISIPVRFLP